MKVLKSLVILAPLLCALCNKDTNDKDALANVGNTVLYKDQMESFGKVNRMYPARMNKYFPGSRQQITQMVDVEAMFKKSKRAGISSEVNKSLDWQWKKRYYPAQLFLMENLSNNLGISEDNINAYYNSHKNDFKTVIKADSTGKDSTVYKSLQEAKQTIIEILFTQENKPDSAFLKSFGDSLPDSTTLRHNWVYSIRNNIPQYFMKKYYKEQYGTSFPDSLSDIYGKDKAITPEDMDVILAWIPEDRKGHYSSPQGSRELVEWLLKWKLFSEQANKTGFTSTKQMRELMTWAWKIEVVNKFIEAKLLPQAKEASKVDTTLAYYAYFDEYTNTALKPDSLTLCKRASQMYENELVTKLDSIIYSIRKSFGVKFLQNDFKDNKTDDPVALIKKADSLRDTGKVDQAEALYTTLSQDFSFLPEGVKATIELAKIQTEKQLYYQAIKNYRKSIINGPSENRCNTFFMIGFIYDEYLNKPEIAEVNYKWVLKNEPGCELADDAEFMMLHLSEPMSSVEELQAEALRQGRSIEPVEEDTLEMDSDTGSAKLSQK